MRFDSSCFLGCRCIYSFSLCIVKKRMIKYFGGNNITNMRMSGYENDILLGSVTFLYQNKRKKLCYINRKILHWLMR